MNSEDCIFYIHSACNKGKNYNFRHNSSSSNNVICRYWREGRCWKQDCKFKHSNCKFSDLELCSSISGNEKSVDIQSSTKASYKKSKNYNYSLDFKIKTLAEIRKEKELKNSVADKNVKNAAVNGANISDGGRQDIPKGKRKNSVSNLRKEVKIPKSSRTVILGPLTDQGVNIICKIDGRIHLKEKPTTAVTISNACQDSVISKSVAAVKSETICSSPSSDKEVAVTSSGTRERCKENLPPSQSREIGSKEEIDEDSFSLLVDQFLGEAKSKSEYPITSIDEKEILLRVEDFLNS